MRDQTKLFSDSRVGEKCDEKKKMKKEKLRGEKEQKKSHGLSLEEKNK